MDFESSMKELENIVAQMENGSLTLEDSIAAFQKGISIAGKCSKMLDDIEKKITILTETGHGEINETDFSVDSIDGVDRAKGNVEKPVEE